MVRSGIYSITNTINNKKYIGSTINFSNRWSRHKYNLNKTNHSNTHLKNAWMKYGSDKFKFEVIEHIENLEDIITREQYWIDAIKPEYNKRIIVENNLGFKLTSEQKEKRRNNIKYNSRISDETRKRMSEAGYRRPPMSQETKNKMSETRKLIRTPNMIESLKRIQEKNKKKVYQYKNNILIGEYESIVKAGLMNHIKSYRNIGKCCLNGKYCGGFNWSFIKK